MTKVKVEKQKLIKSRPFFLIGTHTHTSQIHNRVLSLISRQITYKRQLQDRNEESLSLVQ